MRSFDRTMPEEIEPRDRRRDLAAALHPLARRRARTCSPKEPSESAIHYVGNTMIDTLDALRERIEAIDAAGRHGLERGAYLVVTLHRHWLFEDEELLGECLAAARLRSRTSCRSSSRMHPRTHAAVEELGLVRGARVFGCSRRSATSSSSRS